MQPESDKGCGKVRSKQKIEKGLTERTVMAMATEMAASKLATERSCVLFLALAASVGVDVANAFEALD